MKKKSNDPNKDWIDSVKEPKTMRMKSLKCFIINGSEELL